MTQRHSLPQGFGLPQSHPQRRASCVADETVLESLPLLAGCEGRQI